MAQAIRNVQTQSFGQVERARDERLGRSSSVRNVATRVANTNTAPQPSAEHADTATIFRQQYAQAGIQPLDRNERIAKTAAAANISRQPVVEYAPAYEYYDDEAEQQVYGPKAPKESFAKRKLKKQVGRVVVSTINTWVLSVVGFLSVIIVIFGVISAVFLGMAMALDYWMYAAEYAEQNNTEITITGWVAGLAADLASFAVRGASALSEFLFGFSLDALHPMNAFLVSYGVLVGFTWMIMLFMYIAYTVAQLEPLGGEGASMKMGGFVIGLVGSVIPVANVIPWYMAWGAAVWMWPK